jgi:hypothetical protein
VEGRDLVENRIRVKFIRKHSFYRYGAVIQIERKKAENLQRRGIVQCF